MNIDFGGMMKRFFVFALIPFALIALEKVNLIKDAGFEKNNGVWNSYVGRSPKKEPIPGIASAHDSEKAYSGMFSGSCDTRLEPTDSEVADAESTVVIQGFCVTKYVTDLDSLTMYCCVLPLGNDFQKTLDVRIGLFVDVDASTPWFTAYFLKAPGLTITPGPPQKPIQIEDFPEDTAWFLFNKDVRGDLARLGFSSATTVDSLILSGLGINYPPWRGQKIYWDDIRLTGYADYDVGVKGFVSKDSVWKDTGYTPTARIKNFGRKPADSFLVIATIEGGAGVVYADTLTWSLTADTEDTVSFKEFKPSDAANYTLTVSTVMTPDESDEDDVMSKPLYGSGVEEQPTPVGVVFNITLFVSVPQVSYSLPLGQQGTISLYDPSGRRIESKKVTCSGEVRFNAGLPSGVYFVKLESGKASVTRKAVVLK